MLQIEAIVSTAGVVGGGECRLVLATLRRQIFLTHESEKVRSIAHGDKVVDALNYGVVEEVRNKMPAGLTTARVGLGRQGLFEDRITVHGDVDVAYLTTVVGRDPKDLVVPRYQGGRGWEEVYSKDGFPVWRLLMAVCGSECAVPGWHNEVDRF